MGAVEADARGGAEAGAAGGVSCLDVGKFCEGAGCDRPVPTASSHQKRRAAERQAHVCGPSAAAPFAVDCLVGEMRTTQFFTRSVVA